VFLRCFDCFSLDTDVRYGALIYRGFDDVSLRAYRRCRLCRTNTLRGKAGLAEFAGKELSWGT